MTTIYDKYEKLLEEYNSINEKIQDFNDIIKKIQITDTDLFDENKRLTYDNAKLLYDIIREKNKYIELENKYNKICTIVKKFTLESNNLFSKN
jgi:hypothetical protein